MPEIKDLSIEFCGVKFPNPVILSSSPVSNTAEMISRSYEQGFGGVAYKTISKDTTKIIHPSPRMASFNYDGKKLVGLQNVEQTSDRPMKDNWTDYQYLKKKWPDRVLIGSIMGFSLEEWKELAISAEGSGADILELNFSCPHMTVEGSGMKVGQSFDLVEKFTEIVKKNVKIPIIAKLTPNITDMNETAMFAKRGGADGIIAINTVRGLSNVGINDFIPQPNIFGQGAISGLSGPTIKPIGLRFIADMSLNSDLNLPLQGCGGIENWIDAVEYLLCGASVVQITTGVIHYGYRIVEDILEGISYFMEQHNFKSVKEIVGKALPNIVSTSDFNLERQGIADYDLNRCIGCGQCYIVCNDAGGQCISWDNNNRKPNVDKEKCLSCMICSFVCPIADPNLIKYKEIPGKKEIIPLVSKL